MSQILKSLSFQTQSSTPGTPSSGFGALYASGSSGFFFKNSAGTNYSLEPQASGPGYIVVNEYTGSNPGGGTLTYTWFNNNPNIKYIQVICVGAGGGGGGNGRSAIAQNLLGGAGGGGGAIAWGFFDSASLTQSSYTISVGDGGAGGSGSSGITGGDGRAGEYTTFGGNMVSASGGRGGDTGGNLAVATIFGGAGGLATDCRPGPGFAIPGGTGANTSRTVNAGTPTSIFSSPLFPSGSAGGGGGSGYSSTLNLGLSGSLGASGFQWNTLISNNTTPANSGSDDLVTATVLLQFTSSVPFTTTYGLGGGGNGPISASAVSVAGGNGGLFGAGGGGSSGIVTSSIISAQPGGSGSSGLCLIAEYY